MNATLMIQPHVCSCQRRWAPWQQHQYSSSSSTRVRPTWRSAAPVPFSAGAQEPISDPRHGLQEQQQQQPNQQQQQQQPQRTGWRSLRELLQTHGPGAVLSYLTVSNVLSVTLLCSTWLLFSRTTGTTPLQDKAKFLAMWAGMWGAQQMARPLKTAVGLAGTPVGTAVLRAAGRVLGTSSRVTLVLLLVLQAGLLLSCLGATVLYANHIVAAL